MSFQQFYGTLRSQFDHILCLQVDYYDSGQFGDESCDNCDENFLTSEKNRVKKGRKSQCCSNGDVNTEEMKEAFTELQNPPEKFIKDLVNAKDEKLREEFLSTTVPLNNTFAFASIRHGDPCPEDQMGGRLDTCKYNGCCYYQFILV